MTAREKLIERLKSKPADFTWNEAVSLLNGLGFNRLDSGSGKKKGGSHRKFYKAETRVLIRIAQPHPQKVLKEYAVKKLLQALTDAGEIDG